MGRSHPKLKVDTAELKINLKFFVRSKVYLSSNFQQNHYKYPKTPNFIIR